MDVTFFEDKPFFETHLQGGRGEREDSNDDVFQIQEEQPVFQTIVENQFFLDESNPTSVLDSEQVRQISVDNRGETFPYL